MPRRWFPVLCVGLLWAAPAAAQGLLVPTDTNVPPLALVRHAVDVSIDEQVSVTQVTQVFRNPTGRDLEATYVFPVPKGASVDRFSMWVNGKEEKGELVEADKARQVYTDIVRRAQDPGLLEYVGQDMVKVRVYPVPAHGDQKLMVRFTAVGERDAGLVEYVYPLKGTEKAAADKFILTATLKSKSALHNVYSPTHSVTVKHHGDHEATVSCECDKSSHDKDFHLYYALGNKDVGLTALAHRPDADAPGHVMLLLSPRAEMGKTHAVPRDMVFVLDTSGSMQGVKMEQARKALQYCLRNLGPEDRFALMHFASTVDRYSDHLNAVNPESLAKARKWVDALEATGGTAIDDALQAALDYRKDSGRSFNIVFFTDGEPTVGETNPDRIVKHFMERNTSETRVFTFGVGDDVNAVLLDQLSDKTRAVSTYVRPEEDIEAKVSGLYAKISHPVLTDLQLKTGNNITLSEVYPPHLPDLFHGGQVVVLARYQGHGAATVTLTGKVGGETKEIVYELDFPGHTGKDRAFVEGLWARRKVGFLLDQIRQTGEKQELVDEVVKLAKKHGITTPYTSLLVVPDGTPRPTLASTPPPMPGIVPQNVTYDINAIGNRLDGAGNAFRNLPPGGGSDWSSGLRLNTPANTATAPASGYNYYGHTNYAPVMAPPADATATYKNHGYQLNGPTAAPMAGPAPMPMSAAPAPPARPAEPMIRCDSALSKLANPVGAVDRMLGTITMPPATAQTGKEGVDLALQLKTLREQNQCSSDSAEAAGRTCVRVGAVWVDQDFNDKTPTLKVKALTAAYFELLAKHPELKDVFRLGTRVVWVTPSGVALVVDPDGGADTFDEAKMGKLFVR